MQPVAPIEPPASLPLLGARARNASGPAGSTGPIMKDAFGLVGGLRRLCRCPLFDSTKVVPVAQDARGLVTRAFHGVM